MKINLGKAVATVANKAKQNPGVALAIAGLLFPGRRIFWNLPYIRTAAVEFGPRQRRRSYPLWKGAGCSG